MLQPGQSAPDFNATLDDDTLFKLSEHRGKDNVVLYFYPADFTFVCPSEVIAFSKSVPDFAAHGAHLLGVSTDGIFSHVAWMEFHVGQLDFPLASDRTQVVSRTYGVLDDQGQSARALFLIDPEGVVRHEAIHDDRVGRSVDETLRVLTALQAPGRTFPQYESAGASSSQGR